MVIGGDRIRVSSKLPLGIQMRRRLLAASALMSLGILAGASRAQEHTLRISVVDSDSGQPIAARLYLKSDTDQWLYFSSDHADGSAVRYEKQNRINKNSFEFHTTVSAHPCSVQVRPGEYQLIVERGKTYFPHSQPIDVTTHDVEITVALRRWADPAARGWYSGDTHLHRTVDELKNVIVAEDLNVALPLTNWVTIAGKPPAVGNKNLSDIPDRLVRVTDSHVIWPRNTEYEIFTVAGKRHTLGALFVLGHRDGLNLGVPPWTPVVESVKKSDKNALFDFDKLDWPFAMLLPTLAPDALYELSNNHVWRTEFAFRKWNTKAPAYIQPPFGATEGGHRQWIDYTLGMYYTLLNGGLRMPPTAGTANGVHPVPAGFGRVYVHLEKDFTFDAWMNGLKQGRSFVTTGPMLYVTAADRDPGHVFHRSSSTNDPIPLTIEVTSESRLSYGELLVNGRPEFLLRPQNKKTSIGSYRSELVTSVTPQRSGWFAVRFWEPRPDGQSRFVHSAPWYVDVDAQPVRIDGHEKRYLLDRVREEMRRSKNFVSDEAMQEYEHALAFYQSLPEIDDSAAVTTTSRKTSPDELPRWLDNMIVDHRFTAHEVRSATGVPLDVAQGAIDARAEQINARATQEAIRILPYPGGRHPRTGFLDGAVHPRRDSKISIFPPWSDSGYVVVDVPEAVFSNLGLTYLAHTHIPTIWDDRGVRLPPVEWSVTDDGLNVQHELPNGIVIRCDVTRRPSGAWMQLSLKNGTNEPLTGLRVQVCNMLKGAVGFNVQEELEHVMTDSMVAVRSMESDRWIITSWQPLKRVWLNPPVPCIHSDPIFPDCAPGETVQVSGGLWFYEGRDIEGEIRRLRTRS